MGSEIQTLGVKKSLFRLHDPLREEADEAFRKVRTSVLERDRYTCRFCGMNTAGDQSRPSGYFQVHHADNDHHNNKMENLVTVCPFCHQVFHAGMAGHGNEPGKAILLPEIDQWTLNRLSHILFVFMELAKSDQTLSEQGKKATLLYQHLQDRSYNLTETFGKEAEKLSVLAKVIARLPDDLYNARSKALRDVRILPIRETFANEIVFWSARFSRTIPVKTWEGIMKSAMEKVAK